MKISLKILRCIAGISVLLLVAGCVTHPTSSTVQPWPGAPPDGYATFLMYCNPSGRNGPLVSIDDTAAFKMRGNSYTWIYVKAGEHRLRTKWVWLMSGLNLDTKITFAAGKSYYTKLLVSNDGNPYVMTIRSGLLDVPEQVARKQAGTCWYRKPSVQQIDAVSEQSAKSNL